MIPIPTVSDGEAGIPPPLIPTGFDAEAALAPPVIPTVFGGEAGLLPPLIPTVFGGEAGILPPLRGVSDGEAVTPPPEVRVRVVKVSQTVIIYRPSAAVFAFRGALTNTPIWQRGILSTSLDAPGPIWVGSRCTEIRSGPDESTEEWQLEVTDYEPNTLLGILVRRGETQIQERHLFLAEGDATRYTVAVEATGGTLSGAAVQKQLVEHLLQLKWLLEGSPVHAMALRRASRARG